MFVWITEGIPTGRYPEVRRDTVEAVAEANRSGPLHGYPSPTSHIHLPARKRALGYETAGKTEEEEISETLHFAKELMTSPVTCLRLGDSFAVAKSIFLEKRFRHLPIVNADQKVMGIVSDRDFWKAEVQTNKPELIFELGKKKVLVANPEAELHFIAKTLLDAKIGCLPVVNDHSTLVGIITRSDILRALVKFPGLSLRI